MLIDADYEKFRHIHDVLLQHGYGCSCFEILEDFSPYEEFIEEVLLGDWGKTAT